MHPLVLVFASYVGVRDPGEPSLTRHALWPCDRFCTLGARDQGGPGACPVVGRSLPPWAQSPPFPLGTDVSLYWGRAAGIYNVLRQIDSHLAACLHKAKPPSKTTSNSLSRYTSKRGAGGRGCLPEMLRVNIRLSGRAFPLLSPGAQLPCLSPFLVSWGYLSSYWISTSQKLLSTSSFPHHFHSVRFLRLVQQGSVAFVA